MPKALHSLWFKPEIDRLWTSPTGKYWAFLSHEKKARLFIARQDSPKKHHELNLDPTPNLEMLYWSPCENWLARTSPEGLVISHRHKPMQTLLPRLNNLSALSWTY